MTAVNTAKTAPDAVLYKPFESKAELLQHMTLELADGNQSRIYDMIKRLSATHTGVWVDPEAVSH